ncbi:hypothetical protein BGZ97_002980 [Linnemannia gamsii]|jgi:hypothetical protein|uniref:Uncharacterized protein n=1 Tax=Linnemannia gamsii TaxID=64522 RepID=A0A9P6QTU3_9FUNG|nr:hypothetical protein BGZ97_002980 [Linnemannia gamsii]
MASPAIYKLRLWLALVCFANLVVVSVYYGWVIRNRNNEPKGFFSKKLYVYNWADYGIIASSVILFLAYIYSLFVKKPLIRNRFVRAILMLLPGVFLLGVMLRSIRLLIDSFKLTSDSSPDNFAVKIDPFTCIGFNKPEGPCTVMKSYVIVPMITGFFVIIEVLVTLIRGPLHPPKAGYF